MIMPAFETERLSIRATRETDGAACLDIWLDDEMGRYLADPPRDKADPGTLNFAVGIENDDAWYPMVAFQKDTGAFLGTCSVVPCEGGACWDLGYAVHRAYWRQGYATEMIGRLIEMGRERGVTAFTATVAKENAASNALLKKLGFHVCKGDGSFRKRGTEIVYSEYVYRLDT